MGRDEGEESSMTPLEIVTKAIEIAWDNGWSARPSGKYTIALLDKDFNYDSPRVMVTTNYGEGFNNWMNVELNTIIFSNPENGVGFIEALYKAKHPREEYPYEYHPWRIHLADLASYHDEDRLDFIEKCLLTESK